VLRSWRKGDAVPISGSAEGNPQGHAWSRCGARRLRTACLAFPSVLRGGAIQSSPVSPGQGSVATYWAAGSVAPFVGLITRRSEFRIHPPLPERRPRGCLFCVLAANTGLGSLPRRSQVTFLSARDSCLVRVVWCLRRATSLDHIWCLGSAALVQQLLWALFLSELPALV
jgi:hypothetical protein